MKRTAMALMLTLLAACTSSEVDDGSEAAKLDAISQTPDEGAGPDDDTSEEAEGKEPCVEGWLPKCASSCCSQPGGHYMFDEAAGCRRGLGTLHECRESVGCGFFELVDCGVQEDGSWIESGSQQSLPHLPCTGNLPDEQRNAPLCD